MLWALARVMFGPTLPCDVLELSYQNRDTPARLVSRVRRLAYFISFFFWVDLFYVKWFGYSMGCIS